MALLVADFCLSSGAGAQPLTVRAAMTEAKARCKGGPNDGQALQNMDVNGDRKPDWIVDSAALGCAPCGALGCEIIVFLSQGSGGVERAFAGRVTGWRLRPAGRPLFEVSRAGPYCPGGGSRGCSESYEARGASLVLAGRGSATFGRPAPRAPEPPSPETATEEPADSHGLPPDSRPEPAAPSTGGAERRRQLQQAPYVR